MGLEYDSTPPKEWIGAKVFAEYAVSLVNRFIAAHQDDLGFSGGRTIPLSVSHAFAESLRRAVEHLPAESKTSSKFKDARDVQIAYVKPLLAVKCGADGKLEGTVPVALLDAPLLATKKAFAHAYAELRFTARREYLIYCNRTTKDGFVDAWNSEMYRRPEDDPNAKVTPWAQADQEIYKEVYDEGLLNWELNETQIYADLCFSGCYAGHCVGHATGSPERSVHTECRLLYASPVQRQGQEDAIEPEPRLSANASSRIVSPQSRKEKLDSLKEGLHPHMPVTDKGEPAVDKPPRADVRISVDGSKFCSFMRTIWDCYDEEDLGEVVLSLRGGQLAIETAAAGTVLPCGDAPPIAARVKPADFLAMGICDDDAHATAPLSIIFRPESGEISFRNARVKALFD